MQMKNIFTAIVLLLPLLGQAQTINLQQDTITWSASSDTNLKTGETFTRTSTFVSYGTTKFEMVNGPKARVLKVTSVEGEWTDINTPGKIIYHILFKDKEGVITLMRDETGLSLTLDLSMSSPDGIRNKYSIDNFTAN